ncbi:MAG: hypothetical protein IBX64_05675 [Actinobacteria bacterium]|nr:hypothetical protein [Actinomycetota bacterium]
MMVVAISLSLIAFSTMLYARTLVQSNMTSGYVSTNPASARITINPGVTPDQIEALRAVAQAEPGVIDATMRAVLSLKIQKDGDDSTPLQLFVAAPDDPMRVATFKIEQGSWPPPADGILLERSALRSLNLKVGDNITVIGFDGKPAQLKVTGAVHDQSLALAGQEGGVGYISANSLPLLGKPPVLNQLAITVADQAGQTEPSHNRDTVVRTALNVADQLKEQAGVSVEQVAVPQPYEHPHQQITNTILTALLAFGALSLLLSAILIATMFNGMLTQQIPQIGMMKAIGARSSRILQLYLMMVLMVSAMATALALLPGVALGRALAQMLLSDTMSLTAIPPASSMLIPPPILEGRWLRADDTNAIVLPQTIRKTLPDIRVGNTIQLSIENCLTTWRVVGIAKELAGATSPCVSQAGFEKATGRPGQANLVRIVTDRHDKEARVTVGQAAIQALTKASIKTQNARPIDTLLGLRRVTRTCSLS